MSIFSLMFEKTWKKDDFKLALDLKMIGRRNGFMSISHRLGIKENYQEALVTVIQLQPLFGFILWTLCELLVVCLFQQTLLLS